MTSYIFDSHVLPDSLVNKGVIHLRVKLGHRDGQPVFLRVANTHLQSFFLNWHNNETRRQQIGEMRRYINRAHPYPNAEPLLLGGDFNVAQYGWASDFTTWNLLYGTMQLWNMDSVQKMCGDRGESGCTGAAIAADNFLGSVLQIFATKPNSYEARMAAYNLIPTRYSSTNLPTLTDHPIKVVDFAYQEIPRTQPACTTYEVDSSGATCPAGTYLAGVAGGPWCDDDGSRNCHVQQVGGTMSTSFTTVQWSPLSCYAPLGCRTWPSYEGTSVTCCGFRNRTPAEEKRATE